MNDIQKVEENSGNNALNNYGNQITINLSMGKLKKFILYTAETWSALPLFKFLHSNLFFYLTGFSFIAAIFNFLISTNNTAENILAFTMGLSFYSLLIYNDFFKKFYKDQAYKKIEILTIDLAAIVLLFISVKIF